MRLRLFGSTAAILTLIAAAPLNAQSSSATAAEVRAGPRIDMSTAGIRLPAASPKSDAEPLLQRRQAPRSQAATLMIVGGAALLVGAVVGGTAGDLLMVGGAVIGLVGLYRYLQ